MEIFPFPLMPARSIGVMAFGNGTSAEKVRSPSPATACGLTTETAIAPGPLRIAVQFHGGRLAGTSAASRPAQERQSRTTAEFRSSTCANAAARIQMFARSILQVRRYHDARNGRTQLRALQTGAGLRHFRAQIVDIGAVGAGLRAAVGQIVFHLPASPADTSLRRRPGWRAIASR